jgi:uncharacterized protein YceK
MKTIKRISGMIIAIVFLSGCATIMSGSLQPVQIYSVQSGATVMINDSVRGKTPMNYTMIRKKKERKIKLVMDGYEPWEINTFRRVNAWLAGNIILGGPIGLVVDAITGAMYVIKPDHIDAQLKKIETH